jgi:hypothetical protein
VPRSSDMFPVRLWKSIGLKSQRPGPPAIRQRFMPVRRACMRGGNVASAMPPNEAKGFCIARPDPAPGTRHRALGKWSAVERCALAPHGKRDVRRRGAVPPLVDHRNPPPRDSPPTERRVFVAMSGAPGFLVQGVKDKWRRRWDSNPRYAFTHAGFQDRCIRPLCHSSGPSSVKTVFRFWKMLISGDFRRMAPACFSCCGQDARLAARKARKGIAQLQEHRANR